MIVPIPGQSFRSFPEWVNKASSWLTSHPEFKDTENGDKKGWRGHHFKAMCFDQKWRRCRMGADFQRADDEGAFPVWWIWPDQIPELVEHLIAAEDRVKVLEAVLEQAKEALRPWASACINDNGDISVNLNRGRGHEDYCGAYLAERRIRDALSTHKED